MTTETRCYGSWISPISASIIASGAVKLEQVMVDGGDIYWVEGRPLEGGRNVICRRSADGAVTDAIPSGFNARSRVQEYGGGSYLPYKGNIFFSNLADNDVWIKAPDQAPQKLTGDEHMRYADLEIDDKRNRLIAVREDHCNTGKEPVTTIAAIDLVNGRCCVLVSGNDFYACPRLSPDGKQIAWVAWDHPNMPWDGSELWLADVDDDGTCQSPHKLAGGPGESILQPEWSADGVLYFVCDRSGWWNIYRYTSGAIQSLADRKAEFGRPIWVFGQSSYAFDSAHRLICAVNENGIWQLAGIDTTTFDFKPIRTPYSDISYVRSRSGKAYFCGGSPSETACVVQLDLASGTIDVLRRSSSLSVDRTYFSIARAIEFPTSNGLTAHAFFYPPNNPDYAAPEGELPPLVVKSHGGPTSATTSTLSLGIQYWTSRGIAVLDVNYGGSTGFGRAYRERLNGQWGVVDVDDCVNGARYLVEQELVDPERLAISGGSAGGYTTLCALTFRDTFKAGASYYGISDLEALLIDTHKFESRYEDSLIGPYPERSDLYKQRSPIHFTDGLSCPIIFFQGLEDKVVLPNQSQMMVEALRKKGLPVAYLTFEGEQHGFRKAQSIERCLEAELYFYSRIFGFEVADDIPPVEIQGLAR